MSESAEPLPVSVRPATVEDIEDLIPLYAGFMRHEGVEPPPPDEFRFRLDRLLRSESDDVLIAYAADGEPVGYLQQRYFYAVWRPLRDAFIEDVFVSEQVRGRRVGERLLEFAYARARERGVTRIALDTNENNRRGRALYERLGFENRVPVWENGRELFYSRRL